MMTEYEYLKAVAKGVTEKVTERVTEKQRRILQEIKKNRHITTEQLSVIVGISSRKIKENIKKLKEKGFFKKNWFCQRWLLGSDWEMRVDDKIHGLSARNLSKSKGSLYRKKYE